MRVRVEPTSPPRVPELPAGWDAGRDLLVWVGRASATLAELARQGRVLRFPDPAEPSCDPASGGSGGETLVRSRAELFQAILALRAPLPVHVAVHRGEGASPAWQREVAAAAQGALRSRALQQRTVVASAPTWCLQGLANLGSLARHPSIAPLRGSLAGVPAVLVSPGPSLDRNVEQLSSLKGRALLVSGTHALQALARAGVTPDLVMCADPGDLARHWAGVPLAEIEAFVVAATCRSEAFDVPARRILTFAGNSRLDEWLFEPLGEAPYLATGGSVSCSQLSLALHLACDPIAFVGQDLSFGERFYAAGGLDGDARVELADGDSFVLVKPAGATGPGSELPDGRLRFTVAQRMIEVPGWDGGTVRTTPALKAFLDWFEYVAASLAGKPRLLNCTEGGARIAGMEHLPLSEAARSWRAGLELGGVLDRAHATSRPEDRRARLARSVSETLSGLERSARLAASCRSLARRASADPRALHGLQAREQELVRALRETRMVSLLAQEDIARAREAARIARSLPENLDASTRLYQAVERAAVFLRQPLRDALERLA